MKIYNPVFSVIFFFIMGIVTRFAYFNHLSFVQKHPEFCAFFLEPDIFIFVGVICIFEMNTPQSLLKSSTRLLLAAIVLSTALSQIALFLPLIHVAYNTAGIAAFIALIMLCIRVGKWIVKN